MSDLTMSPPNRLKRTPIKRVIYFRMEYRLFFQLSFSAGYAATEYNHLCLKKSSEITLKKLYIDPSNPISVFLIAIKVF